MSRRETKKQTKLLGNGQLEIVEDGVGEIQSAEAGGLIALCFAWFIPALPHVISASRDDAPDITLSPPGDLPI